MRGISEENDILRERIAQLEALLGVTELEHPNQFGLSAAESRAFGVIMKRQIATRDALMAALYGARESNNEKIIDVFLRNIRVKLEPFGIEIVTRRGQGWFLTAETKQRVQEMRAGTAA